MAARTATRSKNPRKTAARKPPATTPSPRRSPDAATVPPSPEVQEETDSRAADLRDRSADILEGARWAGAQEAADLIREAEARVVQIRRTAAADTRRLLAEVTEEATERLRRAESEADAVRARAYDDRQALLDSARAEAQRATEEAVAAAEAQVEQLLAEAETQVGEVLAEAEERATALVDMRRMAAEGAYRKALEDAATIRGEAQEQAAEIAARRAGLDTELELTRRSAVLDLKEELAERREKLEGELARQRQENDRAQALVERQFRELGEKYVRDQEEQRRQFAAEAEQLRRRAESDARAVATAAAAEIRKEAAAALKEAEQERDAAREAHELADRRAKSFERERSTGEVIKQVTLWAGLGAVIILTASGEWAFASLVGLGKTPIGDAGWALPVGLDIYAVTAFRKKKDVPFALGLMAATNLTYHAADMTGVGIEVGADGEKHPSVWLISVAVIVVVAIVWRIHRLLEDDEDETPADGEELAETGNPVVPPAGSPSGTAAGSPAGRPPFTGTGNPTGKPSSTGTGNAGGTEGGSPTGKSSGKTGGRSGGKSGGTKPTPQQRQEVRERATEILRSGELPSPTALAAEFGGLDPEWVRNQIRAVRTLVHTP